MKLDNMELVKFRGGGFSPKNIKIIAPFTFIILLSLWQLASQNGLISALILPSPFEIITALIDLIKSGLFYKHMTASLQRLAIGWSIGTILGIIVGFAIGLFSLARSSLTPLVSAIFPVPKIALLPLFVIWFGIDESSKVATILFGTFFPTVIAVYGGVDNVDRNLIRMGQAFNISKISIIFKIILPGAMPAIFTGFRISISIAIILLVAAEMIGAEYGIGAYVLMAGSIMATDQLLAGVFVLSMLGLTCAFIISIIESFVLRWR